MHFDEKGILNRAKIVEISNAEVDDELNHSANDECAGDSKENVHSTKLDCAGSSKEIINSTEMDCAGDVQENINNVENNGIGNIELRRSTRKRRQPDRYGISAQFALSAEQFVDADPISIEDAMKRNDWKEWKNAIDAEYESLISNNTWTYADLPADRKAISCKWVFKLKRTASGEIDKYKARLVARGFSQERGFDYNETYAPVAKLVTLRILLSIANHKKMEIHQMDVKSAFLNGESDEIIYMEQPDGFKKGNHVLKLNKAIYGLKQASRVWNNKFNDFMNQIDFKRCASDRCLYVRNDKGKCCYVLLYVDDLLIISGDMRNINIIKKLLSKQFEMTDIGKVHACI